MDRTCWFSFLRFSRSRPQSVFAAILAVMAMIFVVAPATAVAQNNAAIHATSLRCEYRVNPQGIDTATPQLSWEVVVATSERTAATLAATPPRGLRQTAYQIFVASSLEQLAANTADIWNSGMVRSGQSSQIAYEGPSLESGRPYFWKVRIRDQKGVLSPWSEPATWSMGLLNESDWAGAEWIGVNRGPDAGAESPFVGSGASWIWYAGDPNPMSAPIGTRYFRRLVEIDSLKTLESATISITADNEYVLAVNGDLRVGTGSDYHTVGEYDLLPLLRDDLPNLIAVAVKNVGGNPNPAGLIAMIRLTLKDGTLRTIVTDPEWISIADNVDKVHGWSYYSDFDTSKWEPSRVVAVFGEGPWGADVGKSNTPPLPARYLRREFNVADQEIQRAMLYGSPLGTGQFTVNGARSRGVLGPALSEYDKRVYYETQDVTGEILRGTTNVLSAELGNGRWFAPRQPGSTTFGLPQAIGVLVIEYADGTVQRVVTNTTWKATDDGPCTVNNEYDGELYDARKELVGWDAAGYDDSAWQSADKMPAPKGTLCAQPTEPMTMGDAIPQRKALSYFHPTGRAQRIYDFGENLVGFCEVTASGEAGAKIILRHAESLSEDGSLYVENLRSAKATNVYTLRGPEGDPKDGTAGPPETWHPEFVFHGFRYVEVQEVRVNGRRDPELLEITAFPVHDDLSIVKSFKCSNPLLNQIHDNIFRGVRGNYRSIPTDCPQRDERQGWLGDRAAESLGETYLFDVSAFYPKWMTDIRDAQRDDGALSDVCPTYWPIYSENITWPSAFTFIPGSIHRQYGDTRVLAANYDAMVKWIRHMEQYITSDGITERDTYGDWCMPPEDPRLIHSEDPARKTSKGILATAYSIQNYRFLARYAEILGKDVAEIDGWNGKADAMAAAYLKRYYDPATGLFDNGTQTASVLSLAFGIVPESEQSKVFAALVQKIEVDSNGHIGTGLIGAQQLMRTLSENGRADLAYRIATQQDFPSWGYMVDHGATTVWELWNGNTADPAMNSQNHVMLVGDLGIWMYEYLAGIRPEASGFAKIGIKPYPVGDLTWARAAYPSIRGLVESAWKIENEDLDGNGEDQFVLSVTIPPNTTANVYVPISVELAAAITADPSSVDVIQESGRRARTAPGVRFAGVESDGPTAARAVFAIGSGKYTFIAPVAWK